MVSPRKRILQASTAGRSPAGVLGDHGIQPALSVRGQQDKLRVPQVFREYRFFLDIKEGKARTALMEDIKSLGGQLEECLSKEATHLISDCPLSDYPPSTASTGPPSPWTPSQTPSPATSNAGGSTDRTRRSAVGSNSRAEMILSKARQQGKTGGGTNSSSRHVVETAIRIKIQVWSYHKTLAWLQRFKDKYGSLTKSASRGRDQSSESRNKKSLTAPCLKLESSVRNHRPVFVELKTWPSLHYDGRSGSCPFTVPSSRQKNKKLAKRLDLNREVSKPVKKEQKGAGTMKKKSSGFCEICNTNYQDLEQHLITEQHAKFINCADNWKELDAIVCFTSDTLI